jgi:hypothetical protein
MLVDQNSFIRDFFNSLQGPLDRSPYIIFSQQSIFDPHLRDIARRCQATRSPWSPPRPPAAVVPMSQSQLPRYPMGFGCLK